MVASAALRARGPATVLLIVAFSIGAHWPGLDGLLIAFFATMSMATIAACWGCALALRYRTQGVAPLMQAGMFVLILCTTAYAPLPLLTGWLHTVAEINPVTQILEMARQGFVGGVTWHDTWQGLVALAGLLALMGLFALRQMRRMAD
jgi:ABC-2 type transport system permease protein